MRSVLARYLGAEADRLRFAYEANGKPALAGAESASGLRFKQSGSDGVGVLAVGLEMEVGVDVERVRRVPDAMSVAERGLENLWVRPLPAPCEGFVAALATASDSVTMECFRWGPPSASSDAAEPPTRS